MRGSGWRRVPAARARLDAGLHQQIPADVVSGEQADESAVFHYREARVPVGHHSLMHLRDVGARRNAGHVSVHHFGDGNFAAAGVHGLNHGVPRHDSYQPVAVHYRKRVLTGLEYPLQPARQSVQRRKRDEMPVHDVVDRDLAERAAQAHHLLFSFGGDEDKRANHDEP